MSKPNGVAFVFDGDGMPALRTTKSSTAIDAIWNAVEEATASGMTVEEFKIEVAQAWEHQLKRDAEDALGKLRKW